MRISDWSSDVCSSDLLARAILAAVKLPRAKAGLACPDIGEDVDIAAVMLGLDQPRLRGAGRRDRTAILRLRVADREFGADFGFDRGAIACIDTAEVRPGVTVLVGGEDRKSVG